MGCGCSGLLLRKEPSFNELFPEAATELAPITIPPGTYGVEVLQGQEGQDIEVIGRVNFAFVDEFDDGEKAAKRAVTDEIDLMTERGIISRDIDDSYKLAGLYNREQNEDCQTCTMDCEHCRSGNPVLDQSPTAVKSQFMRDDSPQRRQDLSFEELRQSRLSRSPSHRPVITDSPVYSPIKTQSIFSSFEDLSTEAESLMIHSTQSVVSDSTIKDTSQYLISATSNANLALASESSENLHTVVLPFIHSVLSISVCQVTGDSLISIEESIRDLYHYQENPYTSSYYNEDWNSYSTTNTGNTVIIQSGPTNVNDNVKMKGNLNMNRLAGQNPVEKLLL